MWKVIAVKLFITSQVCGITTNIPCQYNTDEGDISRATFYDLGECEAYSLHIRQTHWEQGENFATFCATFHPPGSQY